MSSSSPPFPRTPAVRPPITPQTASFHTPGFPPPSRVGGSAVHSMPVPPPPVPPNLLTPDLDKDSAITQFFSQLAAIASGPSTQPPPPPPPAFPGTSPPPVPQPTAVETAPVPSPSGPTSSRPQSPSSPSQDTITDQKKRIARLVRRQTQMEEQLEEFRVRELGRELEDVPDSEIGGVLHAQAKAVKELQTERDALLHRVTQLEATLSKTVAAKEKADTEAAPSPHHPKPPAPPQPQHGRPDALSPSPPPQHRPDVPAFPSMEDGATTPLAHRPPTASLITDLPGGRRKTTFTSSPDGGPPTRPRPPPPPPASRVTAVPAGGDDGESEAAAIAAYEAAVKAAEEDYQRRLAVAKEEANLKREFFETFTEQGFGLVMYELGKRPAVRQVRFDAEKASIVWDTKKMGCFPSRKHLELESVTEVVTGLASYPAEDPEAPESELESRCLSLLTQDGSLELEAATYDDREFLFHGFAALGSAYRAGLAANGGDPEAAAQQMQDAMFLPPDVEPAQLPAPPRPRPSSSPTSPVVVENGGVSGGGGGGGGDGDSGTGVPGLQVVAEDDGQGVEETKLPGSEDGVEADADDAAAAPAGAMNGGAIRKGAGVTALPPPVPAKRSSATALISATRRRPMSMPARLMHGRLVLATDDFSESDEDDEEEAGGKPSETLETKAEPEPVQPSSQPSTDTAPHESVATNGVSETGPVPVPVSVPEPEPEPVPAAAPPAAPPAAAQPVPVPVPAPTPAAEPHPEPPRTTPPPPPPPRPPVGASGTPVATDGWLTKLGDGGKNDMRAWWVLEGGTLSCFQSPSKDAGPMMMFPLEGVAFVLGHIEDRPLPLLRLCRGSRVLQLVADTPAQHDMWVDALGPWRTTDVELQPKRPA